MFVSVKEKTLNTKFNELFGEDKVYVNLDLNVMFNFRKGMRRKGQFHIS